MSMMIESLHIRSLVSSGCSNVSAGRHPSRLIRLEPLPRCNVEIRAEGRITNIYDRSVIRTNHLNIESSGTSKNRVTYILSAGASQPPMSTAAATVAATHDLRIGTTNVLFSGFLEVNNRGNLGVECVCCCADGDFQGVEWMLKRCLFACSIFFDGFSRTPAVARRPVCLEFI